METKALAVNAYIGIFLPDINQSLVQPLGAYEADIWCGRDFPRDLYGCVFHRNLGREINQGSLDATHFWVGIQHYKRMVILRDLHFGVHCWGW